MSSVKKQRELYVQEIEELIEIENKIESLKHELFWKSQLIHLETWDDLSYIFHVSPLIQYLKEKSIETKYAVVTKLNPVVMEEVIQSFPEYEKVEIKEFIHHIEDINEHIENIPMQKKKQWIEEIKEFYA